MMDKEERQRQELELERMQTVLALKLITRKDMSDNHCMEKEIADEMSFVKTVRLRAIRL
jgi:hypothetical protein